MAGDVVSLSTGGSAVLPLACETKIVCALAADVVVAEMVVEGLWIRICLGAVLPETSVGRLGRLLGLWIVCCGGRWVRALVVSSRGKGRRRRKGSGHGAMLPHLGPDDGFKERNLPSRLRSMQAKTRAKHILACPAMLPAKPLRPVVRTHAGYLGISDLIYDSFFRIIHSQHLDPLSVVKVALSVTKRALEQSVHLYNISLVL